MTEELLSAIEERSIGKFSECLNHMSGVSHSTKKALEELFSQCVHNLTTR